MLSARPYDRTERLSDALVHLVGLGLALVAVPVLIAQAVIWHADATSILAVSIYGGTLIAMLTASLAYNHVTAAEWSGLLRRLDQSAIFLKIAGTVTPFVLLSGTGAAFLVGMWIAAIGASLIAVASRRRTSVLSIGIGLSMGWAVLLAGGEVLAATTTPVFALMVAGGIAYSLGTPFLLWKGLRFHNTIWHGFVVIASIVFFVAIMLHLVATAPA